MEIAVFSPGGLGSAQKLEKVPFTQDVLQALEREAAYLQFYRRDSGDVDLATRVSRLRASMPGGGVISNQPL